MIHKKAFLLLFAILGLGLLRPADAAEINIVNDIAASAVWTADNTYNLADQIYVLPGATLTIEAGTVIASDTSVDGAGAIAVARGGQIFVNGTADNPVIMTSKADVATWDVDPTHPTGKDPKTGTWREAANEWGNLTIMGNAMISASDEPGNDGLPTGLNEAPMEGLVESIAVYGGADDDDDSGSISYLSLRYGGRVVTIAHELNGLSLGAIGRATNIDHVEIMNNVDDGIEVWGGTVNLKYVSIWNIGDDSFDIDQGWRGKAQFGLIVQGYSLDASQGSGVGDNMFEVDGAEDSIAQPVTTGVIYNFTAIGQPIDGDHGTAWRDNARMQYRNCVFMDVGDELVKFDNEGDHPAGAKGYGVSGTLSWADTWATDAGVHSTVNTGGLSQAQLDQLYQAQVDGKLAEITDSVFFNIGDYTEADTVGVTVAGGSNPAKNNVVATKQPIQFLKRAAALSKGGKTMERVTFLNPLAANEARVSAATAPNDGFFYPAQYRGAFDDENWLLGWTAADAFGMTGEEVEVTEDITESTVWTADNTYNLKDQIYVKSGATLTIEAGTVVASDVTVDGAGALAVERGAKIFVNGTADNPVIMTSKNDVATWDPDPTHPTGKDPKTGTWREAANEWGNLTIMGEALISASDEPGNDGLPTGLNTAPMEGLVEASAVYGGADDEDDSGSISYLSLRYGGRVVTIAHELNGLSLGALGRATDIDHVEIMNNVDDGIEVWGGTVNLKYVNIWNIGDDSFDIDQGWRGKAQFGLIVQGYSLDASQGSGVGDNMFEVDGAEDSIAQPITTGVIYNFTAVGQPLDGDHATAWRDNARMQYRNCIFMDVGDELVKFDNEGDHPAGAKGYGVSGTLSWADTWATDAGVHSTVNTGGLSQAQLDQLYQAQVDGKLAEITDSVFYSVADYTEADTVGVTLSGGSNPAKYNVVASQMPIQTLQRAAQLTKGGKLMERVTLINPSAANDARTSVEMAPNDGFFTPAQYRGGFSSDPSENWLVGWTATDAYGMLDTTAPTGGEVEVTADITESVTWTANNTYNLKDQIYVESGATLTIEAGTVVASDVTVDGAGALAVKRGGMIFVNGTADNPVIMTSKNDVATWDPDPSHPTGGDPKTGTWREAANEWGNLTIMGNAMISASDEPGNDGLPLGTNTAPMEGLIEADAIYGGADDDDDSGSISYLSLRYGGRVVTIAHELNGLSLGALGRATDIDHVEIMNNVDDGIEVWGGTVNLKYVSIWNIGDDSFDIDQGWRGKAQFGLIVQGYSLDASQGSGVGDNMFEVDGAEDSIAQPITTGVIYNFTAVGQPLDGDHATAWRDNARMQYRNCVFMDVGDELVKFDNEGDHPAGAKGYGVSGTLSWADTWDTNAGVHSTVNTGGLSQGQLDQLYQAQVDGKLAEITDSVFFNVADYAEADTVGVTVNGDSNPAKNNLVLTQMPIQSLQRDTQVTKGGKLMERVISINPSAAGLAAVSAGTAPNDGFFTPAAYRGGFSPDPSENWLADWSAADAYGFLLIPPPNAVSGDHWQQLK